MIAHHGTETVSDVSKSLQVFSAVDYTIFFMMLLLCALIGIYFGLIKSGKNKTASDYLMGGRSMSVFPISLSLIASYISGITLLGFPTEVYIYGNQYSYSMGGLILMGFLMCHLYLPTLHDLQLTSSYEYLSLRFDNRVRLFGSILFCISIMNWLPLVVYVPALAFNQVTGVNVHIITPFVSLVCVFYTSLGGLKAVVWTDVLQTFSMFGAMMLVCIKGTIDVGGIGEVLRRNMDTGRVETPDVRLDPTVRHSIWGLVFGGSLYYLQSNAISQAMIQRYLALPTLKKAKRAVWYFVLGTLMLTVFCTYSGFLIFATFYKCDPLTTKLAKAKDQLLPLLVMETLGDYPGLPGLFVAGVFSAALSSMSTGMNSMSAVVLEDFYKTLINNEPSERVTNIIMRSVVIIVGIICVFLVYVVERLGQVLQLAMSLSAITNGPSMGVFTMGLFFPWINATGALWGGLTGLAAMTWLIIGTQNAIATGSLKFQPKPVTTSGCKYIFSSINKTKSINNLEDTIVTVVNVTNSIGLESYQPSSPTLPIPEAIGDEVFLPFRLSYLWYTLIGMVVSISTAAIISYVTNKLNGNLKVKPVQANLLSPIVRRYYQRNKSPLATIDNKAKHLDVKMNARKLSSTYSEAN